MMEATSTSCNNDYLYYTINTNYIYTFDQVHEVLLTTAIIKITIDASYIILFYRFKKISAYVRPSITLEPKVRFELGYIFGFVSTH